MTPCLKSSLLSGYTGLSDKHSILGYFHDYAEMTFSSESNREATRDHEKCDGVPEIDRGFVSKIVRFCPISGHK